MTAGEIADKTEFFALDLRLFGAFDVRVQGQPMPPLRYRKEQWLLALLVLRHGQEVSRDWLVATFWPENEESQGKFYLRKSLSNLRNALGPEAHRLQSPTLRTVRLDLSDAFADFLVLDTAIVRPRTELDYEERLIEAVDLYRGPLLQECQEGWIAVEREYRAQSYLKALEILADYALTRGEVAAASRWLRRAITAEPYRESAVCSLMQVLADSGDRAAVQQVYQDLKQRLRKELNAAPSPETDALHKHLTQQEVQPPPPHAAPTRMAPSQRHLPVPLTDLIGRAQEVEEVGGWLERRRLVTLLGPGGVGKTRLAIAVAEAVLPRFDDGVWFVDLASVTDATYVSEITAKALRVPPAAGQSAEERLIEALSPRSQLIVLDNCEHLLDACASLADILLSACPAVRILATSRQVLTVTGEQVFPVPSLALPAREEVEEGPGLVNTEKNPAFLMEYAGIQLFVQRAVQADPAFRLDRRSAQAVAAICLHLDGIPLAIEMAAARVRSLSVAQIAARLEDRFQLLTGGNRAALPRQRTLQAAIDWSYDLLTEAERVLLRRLSVFAGGWSLEAAEAVCANGDIPQWEVQDVLTQLVEKSLVVFEEYDAQRRSAGERRYRLLETVRQYAQDRLRESKEDAAVGGRHRDYFTAFAEEARRKLTGSEQSAWSQRLEVEHDNIRSAIAWCRDDPDGAEAGLRLTGAMGWFWATHGYLKEGQQHLAEALARDSHSRTRVRAEALNYAAQFANPDYATAQSLYEECLAIQRELGDEVGVTMALTQLSLIQWVRGDYVTALTYLEESLAIQQTAGARQNSANTFYWLGCIAEEQGDIAKTRFYLAEAHAIDLEFGNRAGHAAWRLGDVLCMQGEYAAARTLLIESLKTARELGDKFIAISALEFLAWLAHSQGDSERAAKLYGAADFLRTTYGYALSPPDRNKYVARTIAIRAALGDAAFTTAWEQGRSLSLEQCIDYGLADT
jgi:non-specific serine/threonine protein kinase